MRNINLKIKLLLSTVILILISSYTTVFASDLNQIPTVDIPTVTSTPSGPIATVRLDTDQAQINVRSGPGTFYEKVGVLLAGQSTPAKGRSVGGDWLLVEYPGIAGGEGWVYAPLVSITPGSLPIIEPPPTPTPLVTPTINPTLAAQFVVTAQPTRLPTFTEAPPLAVPKFTDLPGMGTPKGIPMGLIIIGLGASGIFLGLFAIAQGK